MDGYFVFVLWAIFVLRMAFFIQTQNGSVRRYPLLPPGASFAQRENGAEKVAFLYNMKCTNRICIDSNLEEG
jgi:hypothetical protein